MNIKAAIIEDEAPARETIKNYLKKYFPGIKVVHEVETKKDAIILLANSDVDLVFLDVQLKDGSGIDILKSIDKPSFKTVFTTAYDNFTKEAFEYKAFGYLLKPINPIDFKEIINRVLKDLTISDFTSLKIKIPSKQGTILIDSSEIIRCESDNNYTVLYCANGEKHMLSKTLKHVELEILPQTQFIRAHQSHLVNLSFINPKKIGSNSFFLLDGLEIPVSRSKKEALIDWISRMKE